MHARLIAMLLVLVHAFAGMMPLAFGASPTPTPSEACCCCELGACCCGCDDESGIPPSRDDGPQEGPGEKVPVCPCSPRTPVPVRTGNGSDAVVAAVAGGVVKQTRRLVRGWNDESKERAAKRGDVAVHAVFDDGPSRLHSPGCRLVWHCRWQV